MKENVEYPRCRGCGYEIDPDLCYCGDLMGSEAHDHHAPVPLGCVCFYVSPSEKKEIR